MKKDFILNKIAELDGVSELNIDGYLRELSGPGKTSYFEAQSYVEEMLSEGLLFVTSAGVIFLSPKARFLLRNGGYEKDKIRLKNESKSSLRAAKRHNNWIKFSIIATILMTIISILLTIWSFKSEKQKDELEKRIEHLEKSYYKAHTQINYSSASYGRKAI